MSANIFATIYGTPVAVVGHDKIKTMKTRIIFTLLLLLLGPVFKGTSQSIEIEALGGVSTWAGKILGDKDIPRFKYVDAYVGAGLNYQILSHSFLTSGLYYYQTGDRKFTQIRSWNVPLQWSQRYGKKVQVQLGLGLYTGLLRYHIGTHYGDFIDNTGNHTLGIVGASDVTKFDFGFAGSASVYIPVTKVLAIKAGINQNWGLKKQLQHDTVKATNQKTTALFLGLSIKLKK